MSSVCSPFGTRSSRGASKRCPNLDEPGNLRADRATSRVRSHTSIRRPQPLRTASRGPSSLSLSHVHSLPTPLQRADVGLAPCVPAMTSETRCGRPHRQRGATVDSALWARPAMQTPPGVHDQAVPQPGRQLRKSTRAPTESCRPHARSPGVRDRPQLAGAAPSVLSHPAWSGGVQSRYSQATIVPSTAIRTPSKTICLTTTSPGIGCTTK